MKIPAMTMLPSPLTDIRPPTTTTNTFTQTCKQTETYFSDMKWHQSHGRLIMEGRGEDGRDTEEEKGVDV